MELTTTLRAISDDARGWLTAWSRDFTEVEARQRGPGEGRPNPLVWQLGHIASVEDEICWLFGATGRIVPADLRALCATGGPAPGPETRFPLLSDVWSLLDVTHAQLLQILDQAGTGGLDREPREPHRFFRSLGQAVYEAALHENYHVGEIGALRKAIGKPRIG